MKLDINTVLFILNTAMSLLKAYVVKDNTFDVPLALVRISQAANKAYTAEVGEPIDESKLPAMEMIP